MKNLFISLSLIMMFVLTACGGNKYDDAIDDVISQYKEEREVNNPNYEITRDNALVKVFDGGKYIQVAFYTPKDSNDELSSFSYYEKQGDEYIRLEDMSRTGENDRLGLSKKTPDYEEAKGKETKLEE
ncbi:cystatin-like fold lipoprotein [Bacillus halotolerans]|uniref:cystatin-like fold lipoprotein n=1 Tax=Bacillus halotolerans TaxID=260554 RepID=UPI002934FEAF|nr:cystatin-like fold lipoprotein [Bacillus halotolerans]WOC57451.1 cystatin-like fold lipoprotein [Bacillus halotolerans]